MKRIVESLVFPLAITAALAQPVQIVVPNGLASVEGNASMSDFLNSSSFRMQMVFDASQFAQLPDSPNLTNSLNSIAFRLDGASTDTVASFFGGSTITVSTTPRSPDSLSPVFTDNVGADAITIFNGAVAFGNTYRPGTTPQPFNVNVLATAPFFYYPSQGNLLLDIRGRSGQVLFPGALDAQGAAGDAVSRVFANSEVLTSGTVDNLGLVAQFNFTVVPEPSTWCLLAIALGLTLLFRRRKPHGSH